VYLCVTFLRILEFSYGWDKFFIYFSDDIFILLLYIIIIYILNMGLLLLLIYLYMNNPSCLLE